MASPQTALNRELQDVLSTMAGGSQDDLATVASVSLRLWHALRAPQYRQNTEKLRPSLRLLLQAAGWLYPGFMPSSSLHPDVQAVVQQAWTSCMHLAHSILSHDSLDHMPAVLSLVQPHDRPQVPGALDWMGDMAGQLTLDVIQRFRAASSSAATTAFHLLSVWHWLARGWEGRERSPQSALMVLQPGMLRLVQRLALQPPPAPAAAVDLDHRNQNALLAAMSAMASCSGVVLDAGLHPALKPGYERVRRSSSSRSMADSPTAQQTTVVLGAEAIWWQGVAALASCTRSAAAATGSATISSTAASSNILATTTNSRNGDVPTPTGSSSSSGSRIPTSTSAAALCPRYHKGAAWPAGRGAEVVHQYLFKLSGMHSLELLLLREMQGSLSWVLEQLRPFQAASTASSSSEPGMCQWPVLVQWPMGLNQLGGANNSSSSNHGGSGACKCSRPACHLCTPPEPVTLQQLRLVLEVVCLTCQECSPEAQQAPVLLALLLQRAAPGVRAAFLNSADGTRLLVALQEMGKLAEGTLESFFQNTKTTWRLYRHAGALSVLAALNGEGVPYWRATAHMRAVCLLAWCYCEVNAGASLATTAGVQPPPAAAAAAAAAAAGRASKAAGASGAGVLAGAPTQPLVTPGAVAHGSVLTITCFSWQHCLHTLQVPTTSLRLAAGVQPSLALFATLEGLLRCKTFDNHPMAMAALLAAIQALLEPFEAGGCSCSQAHTRSNSATGTATSSSNNSSSYSGGTNASGTPLLPGVMEAVASVAVTVSKILLSVEDNPTGSQANFADMVTQREVVVLGAHLSNAVLQLALQQVQQQKQQQGHLSKAALCLVEAAHRLLRHAARGAVKDMQQQAQRKVTATTVVWGGAAVGKTQRAATDTQLSPADSRARVDHLKGTSRPLFALLHTGRMRLLALQSATTAACTAGAGEQPGVGTSAARTTTAAPASGAAASASAAASARAWAPAGPLVLLGSATPEGRITLTPAPAAYAAAVTGSGVSAAPQADAAAWCAAHSRCPAPEAQGMAAAPDMLLGPMLNGLHEQIKHMTITRAPLIGCGTYGCIELLGPSETWLVHNWPEGRCGGCGVVRYCCPEHARHSWPTHRKACRRLGAALGRAPIISSSTTPNSSSKVVSAEPGTAGPAVLPRPLSASGGGGPSHSSSNKDSTSAGDQGPPPGGQVCGWCGKASQQLLRCGRCNAAWYCGADHQRAAWKARHRQECAAAAALELMRKLAPRAYASLVAAASGSR